MKNNHLYIFTQGFPFGNDENYLNDEINFLAEKFDLITLIAPKLNSGLRQLPENIDFVIANISLFNRFLLSFKALFSKYFLLDIKRVFYKRNGLYKSILTLLYSLNHISIAQLLFRKAIKKVNDREKNIYYGYWAGYCVLSAIMCNQKIKGTVVSRVHRWDLYEYSYPSQVIPLRYTLNSYVDHLCFLSEEAKSYYYYTIEGEKKFDPHIFPLGCNGDSDFTISNRSNHVVSCSRIVPVKRIKLIIDALSTVKTRPLKWTHLGGGESENDILRYANKILTPKGIEFNITSTLSHNMVIDFYREGRGDIFINASESEGMPVSIMEAMAYGFIIIATDVGGTSQMVDDSFATLVEKDVLPTDLGECIDKYLSISQEEVACSKLAAHEYWKENFNMNKNYNAFASFLIGLCGCNNEK